MQQCIKLCLPLVLLFSSVGAQEIPSIRVVNFAKCIESSQKGKQEQKELEAIKNQMQKTMQDLEEQFSSVTNQLQDKDFLDSLSPEGERELKGKYQQLGEELQRHEGQFYQVMQQAKFKLIQTMKKWVNQAAETLAKKDPSFSMILNEEIVFYIAPGLDITEKIIAEIDKRFDQEKK